MVETGLLQGGQLFNGLNFDHRKVAVNFFRREVNFVARFGSIEQGRVLDAKNHRHWRHIQIFNFTVLDGDFSAVFIDFLNFALGHRQLICCSRRFRIANRFFCGVGFSFIACRWIVDRVSA